MEKIKVYDQVIDQIERERDELVKLCLDLGNTASPHGKERIAGEKVLAWLKTNGDRRFSSVHYQRERQCRRQNPRKRRRSEFDS